MPSLEQLRALKAKTPAAKDMTDAEFALAMHEQAYSDIPIDTFLSKNGLDPAAVRKEIAPDSPYAKYLGVVQKKQDRAKRSTRPTGEEDIGVPEGIFKGVAQGATFGFSDEIAGGWNALTGGNIADPNYWAEMGQRYAEGQADEARKIKSFEEKNPFIAGASELGGNLLTGLIAAPFTGGASLGTSLGRAALMGAGSGALYGYGKAEDPNDPNALFSLKRAEAAIPTALLSGIGGVAGAKIASLAKPVAEDAVVRSAANVLENAGVKSLTAGQKTGNAAVQALEGRSGKIAEKMLDTQKQEFANAVWKDLKVDRIARLAGNRASRGVFNKADDAAMQTANNIYTKAYEKLESFPMLIDRQLSNDLSTIASKYRPYTPGASFGLSDISPTVREMILKIKTAARSGAISAKGELYNDIYKKLGKEIADPATTYKSKKALEEIQNALSEAMRRGIKASGGGRKAEALLDELRGSYQKFLAVESAAASKIDGKYFDPAALLSAVKTVDDDAVKYGTGRLANMAAMSQAAKTVGLDLAKGKTESAIRRWSLPGVAGIGAPHLFGVGAYTPEGLALSLLAAGGTKLGTNAMKNAEARLAMSGLGQKMLSNSASQGTREWIDALGQVTASAAPSAASGIDQALGLGRAAERMLPL